MSTRTRVLNAFLKGAVLTNGTANIIGRSPEGARELRRLRNQFHPHIECRWVDNKTNNGRHLEYFFNKEFLSKVKSGEIKIEDFKS